MRSAVSTHHAQPEISENLLEAISARHAVANAPKRKNKKNKKNTRNYCEILNIVLVALIQINTDDLEYIYI